MRAKPVIPALLAMLATAAADPAPTNEPKQGAVRSPLGPSKVVEVEPWTPPARPTGKYPGMNGQDVAGIVIPTDPSGDAQPWPYGMWIRPPNTGDHNVIVPGGNHLPFDSLPPAARVTRGLDDGVGQFLEWLMTPRFVKKS